MRIIIKHFLIINNNFSLELCYSQEQIRGDWSRKGGRESVYEASKCKEHAKNNISPLVV